MSKISFNCVDVFAGAGGFSLAAKNLGFKVKLAVEYDRHAASTYKQNICDDLENTRILINDIRDLDPHHEISFVLSNEEHCDLLLGGPPCQGYSSHRLKNSGVNDDRNGLIQTYFDWVKAIRPTVFVMENVPGMLWKRHTSFVKDFYARGKREGYYLFEPVVLDARDYGIPQRRKRVFIVGLTKNSLSAEVEWPPRPTHSSPQKRVSGDGLENWVDCSEVFSDIRTDDINNIHMRHGPELTAAFKNTPLNGGSRLESGRLLDCHKNHSGHRDVYGRIDPKSQAPTMTTACFNPSKGRFVHPTKPHGITIRHAARIQSFPDSFVFHGGLTAAGRQVGNAVPIALGENVIKSIIPALRKYRNLNNS